MTSADDTQEPLSFRLARGTIFFLLLGFVGYIALITIANAVGWLFLSRWIALWDPLVETLAEYLPAFETMKTSLQRRGFGHRVAVVQHLMAVGWLYVGLAMVANVSMVATGSPVLWRGYRSANTPERAVFLAIIGIIFFVGVTCWGALWMQATDGFRGDIHRSDFTLFMAIASVFVMSPMSAGAVIVAAGAFITGRPKSRYEWHES